MAAMHSGPAPKNFVAPLAKHADSHKSRLSYREPLMIFPYVSTKLPQGVPTLR